MKEQSTSKGFAILSAATMAVKVLSLIYNPFLVFIIGGDRPFAIYNATYQIYVFIYVVTNTGIPSAISKLISEYIAVKNYRSAVKTFKISRALLLLIGMIMAVVMLIIAGPLTNSMGYKEAKYSVIALCPAIVFTSVASAYRGYFQGRGNMKPTAFSQVLEQILNTVFSLVFAEILIKHSVEAGCVGATIGTTLGALASAIYLAVVYERNKHFKVKKHEIDMFIVKHTNKQVLKKIIKYSIPITVCIGVTNLGNLIDTTNTMYRLQVAGFAYAKAQALAGTYAKYQTLINVPITIISALAVAVLPAVSKAVALNDRSMAMGKIKFGFRVCFMIAIPSAVGLSVLSMPIFKLLYPRYLSGYMLLIIGSVVLVLMSAVQIQTSILQGLGKLYVVTLYSILGIAAKLIVNYIFIAKPNINIYGAILGSIIGFSVPILLNARYIKKYLKFKFSVKRYLLKPFISSVFMGTVIYIVYHLISLIIGVLNKGYFNNAIAAMFAIFAGMLTYGYTMLLIRGITTEEIDMLPSKVKRIIPRKFVAVSK